jgi:hypothetical protein
MQYIYIFRSGNHQALLPCSFSKDWLPSLIPEKHSEDRSQKTELHRKGAKSAEKKYKCLKLKFKSKKSVIGNLKSKM